MLLRGVALWAALRWALGRAAPGAGRGASREQAVRREHVDWDDFVLFWARHLFWRRETGRGGGWGACEPALARRRDRRENKRCDENRAAKPTAACSGDSSCFRVSGVEEARSLDSPGRRKVATLRHRKAHGVDHVFRLEQDLHVVEAHDRVSAQDQSGVLTEVATSIRR